MSTAELKSGDLDSLSSSYIDSALKEIEMAAQEAGPAIVPTIFFGGGTPSLLPAGQLARIIDAIKSRFTLDKNIEITLEVNPDSVTQEFLDEIKGAGATRISMGKLGAAYLLEKCGTRKLRILTHCNTGSLATSDWGTALGVIRELSDQGYIEEVFADETRPLLQGSRLTAWELSEAGINYRILPDGAAASALFSGLIDAVLIGADRIARNGDSANKIGSLGVAVAAKESGVPFLVVAPESTIDRSLASGDEIEIEFRADSEVTHFAGKAVAPVGAKSYNPAFDVTLARYITAIVTEKCVYNLVAGDEL